MIALLLTLEVAVIAAAFVGMLWLRRASDRHWAIYKATRPMAAAYIRLQIQIRDQLTPALIRMTEAIREMAPAMQRLGEALNKAPKR